MTTREEEEEEEEVQDRWRRWQLSEHELSLPQHSVKEVERAIIGIFWYMAEIYKNYNNRCEILETDQVDLDLCYGLHPPLCIKLI